MLLPWQRTLPHRAAYVRTWLPGERIGRAMERHVREVLDAVVTCVLLAVAVFRVVINALAITLTLAQTIFLLVQSR